MFFNYFCHMGKDNFKYYAFISYAGKDERWARWLHSRLENYHIPAVLCKENPSLPSKIRPVFWYKKDLSGTELKKSLEGELDDSKYLILVCSPAAAASPWVNDEVARFISDDRAGYIIPFIVDGEPHSADPAKECFPPALRDLPRDRELRGIAVNKVGKAHALVDVVATMFGVSFDTLWQRHRRRQRAIRNIWIAVCAVLVAIGAFVWDYTRVRTEYYAHSTDIYGVLKGINPLSSDQVNHRNENLRFSYRRAPFGSKDFYSWRLDRVDVVNSAGTVSPSFFLSFVYPHPSLKYDYDNAGKPVRVTGLDETGHVKQTYELLDDFDGTPAGILDLKGIETGQTAAFRANAYNDGNISSNTRIRRYHLLRDEEGRPVVQTYHASNDDDLEASAIADEDNVYALGFSYDSQGRLSSVRHLDYAGKPGTDRFGVAGVELVYIDPASQYDVKYIDLAGKPVVRNEGYASSRSTVDEYGNLLSRTTLDAEGRPVINTHRFATLRFNYDKNGFIVEEETLGTDSMPILNEGNWARCVMIPDKNGRGVVNRFYDEDGNPTLNVEGSFETRFRFDSAGNMLSSEFFDTEGKPTLSSQYAFHRLEHEYDKDGYVVATKFYGIDGKPCFMKYGYSERRNKYNDYHSITEETYYDVDGNPCASSDYYHRFAITYDRRGNRIREEFFDVDGNLIVNKDGYAVYEFEYDNAGNMTHRRTLDNNRQPMYCNDFAQLRDVYTPKGLLDHRVYLDDEGKPTLSNDWYAYEVKSYDDAGRLTGVRYFDADSLPTLTKNDGIHALSYDYDESGNIIRIRSYDVNGALASSKSYIADLHRKYSNRRQVVDESYFDASGKPVKDNEGIHRMTLKYDSKGNEIERRFFDSNGNPDADKYHVSVYKYAYTPTGNIAEIKFYGKDGRPVLSTNTGSYGMVSEYNSRGLMEKTTYTDADGNPMVTEQPNVFFATKAFKYNPAGNFVEMDYFDEKGNLARTTTSIEKYTRDNQGRIVKSEYFDYNGNPVGGSEGYPVVEYVYASPDSLITRLYDLSGANVLNLISKRENGQVVKNSWTDGEGKPVVYSNRAIDENLYAFAEYDRDNLHRLTEARFYDADGALLPPEKGYAVLTRKYDEKGRLTEVSSLDNNRNLFVDPSTGAARTLMSYDDRGNVSSHYWYDEKGRLAETPWRYSGMEREYDAHGNSVKTVYVYQDGSKGAHPLDQSPDTSGNEAESEAEPEYEVAVVCLVETQGQMMSKGYRGYYIVLQLEDWNIETGTIDTFAEVLSATRGKEKHLVLWQLDENDIEGGTVYDETFSTEPLSARLMDYKVMPIVKKIGIKKLHNH